MARAGPRSLPLITDPQSVPVVGIDSHLPALGVGQLIPVAIATQLQRSEGWQAPLGADAGVFSPEHPQPTPAAVLLALIERAGGLTVLLTQRTAHLRAHAGQVSFPGGRLEASDADVTAAALREAAEEVGLDPTLAEVLGRMPSYRTVTGFEVTPVVALLREPPPFRPDPSEVQEVFEVPLAFLMNPAHHRRHSFASGEVNRQFLSIPWLGRGQAGHERDFFIWGATAAMLRNFYHLLARPLSSLP